MVHHKRFSSGTELIILWVHIQHLHHIRKEKESDTSFLSLINKNSRRSRMENLAQNKEFTPQDQALLDMLTKEIKEELHDHYSRSCQPVGDIISDKDIKTENVDHVDGEMQVTEATKGSTPECLTVWKSERKEECETNFIFENGMDRMDVTSEVTEVKKEQPDIDNLVASDSHNSHHFNADEKVELLTRTSDYLTEKLKAVCKDEIEADKGSSLHTNHLGPRSNSDSVQVKVEQEPECNESGENNQIVNNASEAVGPSKTRTRRYKKEKPFKCNVCGLPFTSTYYLNRHLTCHRGEKPSLCDICGKGFSNNTALKQHRNLHAGKKPYNCAQCGSSFASSSGLRAHVALHRQGDKHKCDICGKEFALRQRLTTHKRRHLAKKLFECDICGAGFIDKFNFQRHVKAHMGERAFKCEICDLAYARSCTLKKHNEEAHPANIALRCAICSREFDSSSDLVAHKKTHAESGESNELPTESDKSEICQRQDGREKRPAKDKIMTRPRSGRRHWPIKKCDEPVMHQTQTGEETRPAKDRVETHATNTRLDVGSGPAKKHDECVIHQAQTDQEKRPTEDSVQTCSGPDMNDEPPEKLKKHDKSQMKQMEVSGDKGPAKNGANPGAIISFKCDECSKEFANNYRLQRHKKTHTGKKEWECDVCGAMFGFDYTLRQHMQIHGGKTFSCDLCDAEFSVNTYLNKHKKLMHSYTKNYTCKICNISLKSRADLRSHRSTHTVVRPFKCKLCKKSFERPFYFQWHMIRSHVTEKTSFTCDVCGVLFPTRSSLEKHIVVHKSHIPLLECSLCARKFESKKGIIAHLKSHIYEKGKCQN